MTVTIDKAALITQIDSIIANLNLSSDESERLALFYKVADNVRASTLDIQAELLSRLETVSSSESLEELLLLIVATSLITTNRSLSVADVSVLNALTDIEPGSIYFVEDVAVPYIKKLNGTWVPVDPLLAPIFPLENAYAWGFNGQGYLGDGTTYNRSSPVSVVGGFADWVQVSVGGFHSLGLRADGTAWAWGSNSLGQVGDSTTTSRTSPVSVVGGFTDWVQVSAGDSHSLGVRANGSLWAWGSNSYGRLGDSTTTSRSSPVSVAGGFTDWVQVSAGDRHSLGVRADGTAWGWGTTNRGAIGDGVTFQARTSPVSVVGGFTDWVQVSAGGSQNYGFSLGVRANGTAWGWGANGDAYSFGAGPGRLGDGTTYNRNSPVSVVGGFADWVQVSAGGSHSLGLRADGTAWAWGYNSQGRLGNNTTLGTNSPVSVVGGFADWVQLSAGDSHSLGVRADGTAWAWAANSNGRLGDDTTIGRSSPVSVVGGFADWVQVSAGGSHSLGVKSSG